MKIRSPLPAGLSCVMVLAIAFLNLALVCPGPASANNKRIKVFVSILPQAYFVERVGGERVDVSVLVGPGHSPATYEPQPNQIAELGKAKIYFRVGVPFEDVWMMRISSANPHMKVIDTRYNIELRNMNTYHPEKAKRHYPFRTGMKDPHIWLSLKLVKVQAENICRALIFEDPAQRAYYQDNLKAFHNDLDKLDAEIKETLKNLTIRKFMAFHPSWGYFASDYGLEQIPIEVEGKEPSAKALAHLINRAKQERVKVVFVQAQFSTRHAEAVAHAIEGRIARIDPLAKDYLNNMRKIAGTFRKVFQ